MFDGLTSNYSTNSTNTHTNTNADINNMKADTPHSGRTRRTRVLILTKQDIQDKNINT